MPKIKSAVKRNELSAERRQANKAKRSALRTAVKKAASSIAGQSAEASVRLSEASRTLDKAAAAGVIHKNTAARKKSRLARKLNAVKGA
ncbi:MAG: 30S ribosomal protein S20 [Patescibacteria group bacterium]